MIAASSGEAPAATNRPISISVRRAAVTVGMVPLPSRTEGKATLSGPLWPTGPGSDNVMTGSSGEERAMAQSNMYAGVAGYVGRADQVGHVGVFSRLAGAETWSHPISEHETYAVHVHPTDPNVVFAGTKDGVYRSTDKGKTFHRANFPGARQIWSFLVDSQDPKLVYAGGSPISIYRSEDTGETWKEMPDPGMPDRAVMPFACRVMRMAQHPNRPGTIYAALEVNGVMRTDNHGESWTDRSASLLKLAEKPHLKSKIVSNTYNEAMMDGNAIAINPADPDGVIFAARMGLFSTHDGGETWQDMEVGRFSPTTYGRDIKVGADLDVTDRKSTRLNSSHIPLSRM